MLKTGHAVLEVQLDPQLFEGFSHGQCQLAVVSGQDTFLRLDHTDLGAELAVGNAQLQADIAATHHNQALGHAGRRQRFGRGDDRPANRQHRQVDAFRAGGQQQVFALDTLVADVDGFAVDYLGPAVNHVHFVLFQQRGNAGGQAVDDAIFPFHAFADVQGRYIHFDAQL